MNTEDSKMITAKEYAEMHNVHYTTVMNWLRRDLVPGAIKEELPFGGYFYKIPAGAPIPELKPGPKTFVERLRAIAAEILEGLSDQYAKFVIHQQAADSNDWRLTYTAHSGVESPVEALRRASHTRRSKRRDSSAAFAEDRRAEARLEKIREERSASEMNPLNLSKSELEKFGVTYKDTTPDQGGGVKRKIAPRLVCNQCGRSWRLPIQKGERSLPNGYWICPKGCNNQ